VGEIAAAAQQMATHGLEASRAVEGVSRVVDRHGVTCREATARTDRATQAIETIAAVAQENSASAEEVTASTEDMAVQVRSLVSSSQELAAMASRLKDAVGRFHLGGGEMSGAGEGATAGWTDGGTRRWGESGMQVAPLLRGDGRDVATARAAR
jgi:hypothetical protein